MAILFKKCQFLSIFLEKCQVFGNFVDSQNDNFPEGQLFTLVSWCSGRVGEDDVVVLVDAHPHVGAICQVLDHPVQAGDGHVMKVKGATWVRMLLVVS